MCYHKRIIFGCNHDSWCARVALCEVQQAFEAGTYDVFCENIWNHPIHSYKVSQMCDSCLQKSMRTLDKLARARSIVSHLNEEVQRLQGRSREEKVTLLDVAELEDIEKISGSLEDSDDNERGE